MTSPESNFSATVKTARGSLITVRGDDADHFNLNIKAAIISEVGANVVAFEDTVLGTISAPAPIAAPPAAPVPQQDTPPAAPAGSPEWVEGRYGDKYQYGHPDAPALPDGRGQYILKDWTSKQGKRLRAWVDPVKGPKPFKPGAVEAELIWA